MLDFTTIISFNLSLIVFLFYFILFTTNDFSEGISFFLLSFSFNLLFLDFDFNNGDLFSSFSKLDQTSFITFLVLFESITLLSKHISEQRNKFKERLRSSVGITTFLFEELDTQVINESEREGHEFNNSFTNFIITKINRFKERLGDIEKSLIRPRLEPIDNSTVNEGRELTSTTTHITNRGEANGHVEILLDLVNEPIPTVFTSIRLTFTLNLRTDLVDHNFLFIESVKFSNFT